MLSRWSKMKLRASKAVLSKQKLTTISFHWLRSTMNLPKCKQSNTGKESRAKAREGQFRLDRHQKGVEFIWNLCQISHQSTRTSSPAISYSDSSRTLANWTTQKLQRLGLIWCRRQPSRSSSRFRKRRMPTAPRPIVSSTKSEGTKRYYQTMSSFNENSENSHLPSETEGSGRPKGQTASQRMMLLAKTLKMATMKSSSCRTVILQKLLTLDLMSKPRPSLWKL